VWRLNLSQCYSGGDGVPVVGAGEEGGREKLRGLGGWIRPIIPAGGVEVGGELCVNEDHAGVRTPGTAKVDALLRSGVERIGNAGVEDDIAGGLVGRGTGLRGDEARAIGVQLVTLEDGGGVAEYVVDATFDGTVDVVLAAEIGEERVLVAKQTAMPEYGAVGAVGDSNGLTVVSSAVLDGEVVGFEARAFNLHSCGQVGSARLRCVERVGDDDVGGRFALTDESDVGVVLGDEEALVIGARDDLDDDAAWGAVWVECGEGMVVEGVLNGWKDSAIFIAGCCEWCCRVDADIHIGGAQRESKSQD